VSSAQLRRELAGIALLVFAVFLGGALAVLGIAQLRAGISISDVKANVGPVGYYLAFPLVALVGWPAAVLAPFAPAVHALRVFGRLGSEIDRKWMIFFFGIVALLPIGVGLAINNPVGEASAASGLWGSLVSHYWRQWLGGIGAWLVWVLALSALTAATLAWNPIRAIVGRSAAASSPTPETPTAERKRGREKSVPVDAAAAALALEPAPEEMPALSVAEAANVVDAPSKPRKRKIRSKAEGAGEPEIAAVGGAPENVGDELPPTDLLAEVPPRYGDTGKAALDSMGGKLMDALRTFRIEGQLLGRTTGPVVTQFEIEPAPGVKVRQIANLSNDLALAMRAASIRIVAPIPGRGAVGVEVPNPNPEIVSFRELIEAKDFQSARAALPIALGKDLEGKPVIADLAKMPHLLIAGATGSGKSICVNSIITSLVYRHTPQTLRLLMVDPKMVELSVYNTLPHLRHKVVTDNRDAAAVLKWAVLEMQDRYELLAANGCRNIQDFNRRVQDGAPLKTAKQKDVAFEDLTWKGGILPYIVVVIDEMADLMMTVQGEVETPIAMLAQKARAIGIHLILATQRPSVDVITGLIKANLPSRISFRVSSKTDSRTILDANGAEQLLGKGDMLFLPPASSRCIRLHGPYISEQESARLASFLRKQGKPVFDDTITAEEEKAAAGGIEFDKDELYDEAARIVVSSGQVSISYLQRKLRVGFSRAARLVDMMEAEGLVSPGAGGKPREVLVDRGYFEEVDAQLR
jgi:S-DNA-T family DNA segregation ATPase FtsK/SpoIIIE